MKVVLISNVKGLGKAGDIVNVSEGYARNFLFPKKLATSADAKSISEAKTKKEAIQFKIDTNRAEAEALKSKIEKAQLQFFLKTHENERLFGSITAKEISAKLKDEYNIEIDKRKIETKENMKLAGKYSMKIKLFEGVTATLKIEIIGE